MIAPGIYDDLSNEDYHADHSLSNSGIKHILQSPAHYSHFRFEGIKDTKALRMGRAIHVATLEPHLFDSIYHAAPIVNKRTNVGKAELAEFIDNLPDGGEPIDVEERENVLRIAKAVQSNPAVKRAGLLEGKAESSIFWTDEETGARCRIRPDMLGSWMVDLKSTENASQIEFGKSISNYGYHTQDAMYSAGAEASGVEFKGFAFLAVEKSAPYGVTIQLVTPEYRAIGFRNFRKACRIWAECTESGEWPGYPAKIIKQEPPVWLLKQEDK